MTIKELEQQLGIPRATIRFYEKENLIAPKRQDNSYREYNEEDITILKKVIILRKIGLSVADIKNALNGDCTLQDLLDKNISQLEQQIKDLEGAVAVSKIMHDKNEDIFSLDENLYWKEINELEKSGLKFKEVFNDIAEFEKGIILSAFSLVDNEGKRLYGLKGSIIAVIATFIIYGLTYYILELLVEKQSSFAVFLEGAFVPVGIILICSVFGLPLYLIKRKNPRLATTIKRIGMVVFVILFTGLIISALA